MNAMHTLDLVASKAFSDAHFDVAGRSFTVMKLLIENIERLRPWSRLAASSSDKNHNGNINGKGLEQSMRESITMLRSSQSEYVSTSVASLRDSLLASATADIVACCGFLEQAASSMTERCVSGNTNAPPLWEHTTHIPIGTTATATAPARIDLAGDGQTHHQSHSNTVVRWHALRYSRRKATTQGTLSTSEGTCMH